MKKKQLLWMVSIAIATTAISLYHKYRQPEGEFYCVKVDNRFPNGESFVSKYTRSAGIVEGISVNGNMWETKFRALEDSQYIRFTEINGSDYKPVFALDKKTMLLKAMLYNGDSIYYQCDWAPQRW